MGEVIRVEFDPNEGRCWECGKRATRHHGGALGCAVCFPTWEPYDPTERTHP